MARTPEIDAITPANRPAVNQLRNLLWNISTERILVEVNPEYSVYNHGYSGDSVIFSWDVTIIWGTENNKIFLLFEVENEEYYQVKYSIWEALADISQKFYIMASYLVINDDGSLNLVETMCNAGITQS